jgi:hypothetical protein
MKNNMHFLSYLDQLFLDWETFQSKVAEKIKTHILSQIYVTTCRVRNGCRTGHVDVSCHYFLIDAFMLERDGPAPARPVLT